MIIGLTGGFNSGKTTVAGMFREKNALVIDADKLAHKSLAPYTKVWKKVVTHFGKAILRRNAQINRAKLGSIVFKDKKKLKWLAGVIHPEVIFKIKRLIKKYKKQYPGRLIIVDVPLLFEAGVNSLFDKLIVVNSLVNKQIERAHLKTGLSRSDILRRINSQIPLAKKIKLADFVIDNRGTLRKTRIQVGRIYEEVRLWI